MTDRLSVYNEALRILGQTKLGTLTDDRPARYTLDDAYDGALAMSLERGSWNFAIRTMQVDSDASVSTQFGYPYAFSKPDDWVSTVAIAADGYFVAALNRYEDEVENWFADVDPIYVRIVSNDSQYGGDLGRWSRHAASALAHQLALDCCNVILQNKGDMADLEQRTLRAFSVAKSKDAKNEPTRFPPTGSLIRARFGYFGRMGRRNG